MGKKITEGGFSMKKRLLIVLVLAMVVAGGAFADWYDSYAPGIDESKVFINAGVGMGFSVEDIPISVSADFKLPIKLPITAGATAAFNSWKDIIGAGNSQIGVTYTDIAIGARGHYHVNLLKNLDTYAGLTLGWVFQIVDVEYGSYWNNHENKPSYSAKPYFLYGFNIGARYFFTKNIGAYLELGYSGLQLASLGLSVKF
jgi:opacity protein-like surface antigen